MEINRDVGAVELVLSEDDLFLLRSGKTLGCENLSVRMDASKQASRPTICALRYAEIDAEFGTEHRLWLLAGGRLKTVEHMVSHADANAFRYDAHAMGIEAAARELSQSLNEEERAKLSRLLGAMARAVAP